LRLLITGASGLYGSKLAELATTRNYEVYSGYNQDEPTVGRLTKFDVSDKNLVKKTLKKVNPEIVVHAAALTDVDKCETNKELAWKINVQGTRNVVEGAKKTQAFLIYISTDYVFNGKTGQYKETDTPDPINYYGLTKLEAEKIVADSLDSYCIGRASVIYGSIPATGKVNFALWVLKRLENNEQTRIVTDQWNSPTLNTNMAEMTLEVIERKLTGIFHLSGATRVDRYNFAKLIAQTFNLDRNLISPTTSAEFSWTAKRPRDSSLNTTKAQQKLRNKPLQINKAIERMKQELKHL
jgi:dTDP-4-dehydrorhamnose reductase